MRKIFIGIIISAAALVGYIAATSYAPQTTETGGAITLLSVEKTTVSYDDMQTWTAKLPPGSGYSVTLRSLESPTMFILGSGNADPNGDARGSFLVARNLPSGDMSLRVELDSDPSVFDEKSFTISDIAPSIAVTVTNPQIEYSNVQGWEASGLPPDAGYVVTVRSLTQPIVVLLGSGSANPEGEASGSFVVEGNIPSGDNFLRIELSSDPSVYGEKLFTIG